LLGPFQRGDTLFKGTYGRVGIARVNIARHFASKASRRIGRRTEHVAGGWVNRLTVLALGGAMLTGAHRQGVEADAFKIAVQTSRLPFLTHTYLLTAKARIDSGLKIPNRPAYIRAASQGLMA